jgi:hypothetical protein
MIYEEQDNLAEAVKLLKRVVEIDEQLGHPDLEEDREALERVRGKVSTDENG